MWPEIGILALIALGLGVLYHVYNPHSFNGGRISTNEARLEQLKLLESMFAEKYPDRAYEIVSERFAFSIPNENDGVEGVEISVDFVFEMSVWYFGDLHHVHYCGDDDSGHFRKDVEKRIGRLLGQLDRIFQGKVRFYWCKCGKCGPDGLYDIDETPEIVDRCGGLEEHISWFGAVPI